MSGAESNIGLHNLVWWQSLIIQQGRYADCADKLIIRVSLLIKRVKTA